MSDPLSRMARNRERFHRYAGEADDPPTALCAACGVRKDRAIHDQATADRHGGFQDVSSHGRP